MAKSYRAPISNTDPPLKYEIVDVASVDFTPANNGAFRGINCSTAGLLYVQGIDDVVVPQYMNLGWNPVGGKKIKKHASNVAVPIAAGKD